MHSVTRSRSCCPVLQGPIGVPPCAPRALCSSHYAGGFMGPRSCLLILALARGSPRMTLLGRDMASPASDDHTYIPRHGATGWDPRFIGLRPGSTIYEPRGPGCVSWPLCGSVSPFAEWE